MNTAALVWLLITVAPNLPPGQGVSIIEYKSESQCKAVAARTMKQSAASSLTGVPSVNSICVKGTKE